MWVETGINQHHFLSWTGGILVPGWTGAQLVSRGRALCPALPLHSFSLQMVAPAPSSTLKSAWEVVSPILQGQPVAWALCFPHSLLPPPNQLPFICITLCTLATHVGQEMGSAVKTNKIFVFKTGFEVTQLSLVQVSISEGDLF